MKNGNPQTEDGYFEFENEIAEALARIQLSGYESRYLWVLWRKIYGWHKKEDNISNSQFVEATGIKKSHISRTEKQLIQRNIVTKNGNKLRFNKHYKDWRELPKMVTGKIVTKNGSRVTKFGHEVAKNGNNLRGRGDKRERNSSKETIQKKKSRGVAKKNLNSTIERIFTSWKEIMDHPKALLTSDRKQKIGSRLKEGYSEEDCLRAIKGCKASKWHQGENPTGKIYDEIGLIFRNGGKLESFWQELEKEDEDDGEVR